MALRIGRTSLACLVIAVLVAAFPAWAGGIKPYDPIDAEKLIKDCWAISDKLRSSTNTNKMRAGILDSALCLEEEIIKNAHILISDSSLNLLEIKKKMKRLRFAYGGLYWSIYNDVEACDPGCGSIYYTFHNSELARLYEQILKDIIEQRNKYRQ